MKKTIITLLALAGVAMGDTLTWKGAATGGDWTEAANWTTTGEHTTPQNNDTIVISNGSTVVHNVTGNDTGFVGGTTTYKVSNNSHLTLGTAAPSTNIPAYNPRYDGSFIVDSTSSITTSAAFFKGTSEIYGEFYLKNNMKTQTDATINFGENGFIAFVDGSRNAMEGDSHTLTLGAILDVGNEVGAATTYILETRYLIKGVEGGTFDPTDYGTLTLAGGTVTGTNNTVLTSTGNTIFNADNTAYTTAMLTATADDYGKYQLGADKNGVFVQYVKAIPEPATATLSLLALAGLAARRRRK